jgi:hypothetical protein
MWNGSIGTQRKIPRYAARGRSGKCTILEGDWKIANGDISEDQVSTMAKRFGEGRGFRPVKLGRSI